MKYSTLILIVILFFLLQCARQTYRIHIGESFYPSSQQLTNYGGSAIAAARADTLIELTGIYCDKNIFLDRYPVIRIYSREQGRLFAPLSARLDCQDGSLINIKGRVVNLPITYSVIKKTLYYNHLEPRTYYTVSDNQKIIDKVNVEFQKIRDDLQKNITIEQSKLQLSLHPEWDIWFDEQTNIFIFHSHQYDLMYAADIDFVVDAKTGKIKDVFAREWFKGE
jgi:hypothetical protein